MGKPHEMGKPAGLGDFFCVTQVVTEAGAKSATCGVTDVPQW